MAHHLQIASSCCLMSTTTEVLACTKSMQCSLLIVFLLVVDFQEFIMGLSLLCKGSAEEKLARKYTSYYNSHLMFGWTCGKMFVLELRDRQYLMSLNWLFSLQCALRRMIWTATASSQRMSSLVSKLFVSSH